MQIVAEIGCSHKGDISLAKAMMVKAKEAGFTAVKFQKRTPYLCVPKSMWRKQKQTEYGVMDYIEYRILVEFNKDQYMELMNFADNIGIEMFASVSDIQAAKDLKDIGMQKIKIPSSKVHEFDMINFCRHNFPDRIMSTGMSSESIIYACYMLLQPDVLCHSVAEYPTQNHNLYLGYIEWLKNTYNCKIGYSGHAENIISYIYAVYCGCDYIERHVCFSKKDDWISDNVFSLQIDEYKDFVEAIIEARKCYEIGDYDTIVANLKQLLSDGAFKGNEKRKVFECEIKKMEELRGGHNGSILL